MPSDSLRQLRKVKRGGGPSRKVRRAQRRLQERMKMYEDAQRVAPTPSPYTRPGSLDSKC